VRNTSLYYFSYERMRIAVVWCRIVKRHRDLTKSDVIGIR